MKIILNDRYKSYEQALEALNLQTLFDRRQKLCLNFAMKTTKHRKMNKMFPLRKDFTNMKTRINEKYEITMAHTERLKRSALPHMQRMLNDELKKYQLYYKFKSQY